MILGVDLITKIKCDSSDPTDHIIRLITDLMDVYERARSITDVRAENSANRLSKKAVQKFYRPGDIVLIEVNSLEKKPPTKLAP